MANLMLGLGFGFNLFKINLNKLGGLNFVKYLCTIEFDYVENKLNPLFVFIILSP